MQTTTIVTKPTEGVRKWRLELLEKIRANRLIKGIYLIDYAKTGQAVCRKCGERIGKGCLRIAKVTFQPNRLCKYYHFDSCVGLILRGANPNYLKGIEKISMGDRFKIMQTLVQTNLLEVPQAPLPELVGELDMPRFAGIMTTKYTRFRSFNFGLPDAQKYGKNWNWRCLLATMLVCNTHETAMLKVTNKLFEAYQTPESFVTLMSNKEAKKKWMDWMEHCELRHVGRKLFFILRATQILIKDHDGEVPEDRETLEAMHGVGRHVASIVMAWVHQKGEFGIDTHVSRILKRWNYVPKEMKDIDIEEKVKQQIPEKQLGAFSRAFVDHGQRYCGYTPNCKACPLRGCCPSASQYIDW